MVESEREKMLHQEAGRGAVVIVSGQQSHVLFGAGVCPGASSTFALALTHPALACFNLTFLFAHLYTSSSAVGCVQHLQSKQTAGELGNPHSCGADVKNLEYLPASLSYIDFATDRRVYPKLHMTNGTRQCRGCDPTIFAVLSQKMAACEAECLADEEEGGASRYPEMHPERCLTRLPSWMAAMKREPRKCLPERHGCRSIEDCATVSSVRPPSSSTSDVPCAGLHDCLPAKRVRMECT